MSELFSVYDRNFDIKVGRSALERSFDDRGGGGNVKHAVQRGSWVITQHLLYDRGKPRKVLPAARHLNTGMLTLFLSCAPALCSCLKNVASFDEQRKFSYYMCNENTYRAPQKSAQKIGGLYNGPK
jgi:hypothetical protein